mgnify:CR=1 FL=1
MNALPIHNPATGALIAELPVDDAASVGAKAARARAAQPAWAARPLAERQACIRRFRAALEAEVETLAATLTAEFRKPIRQSLNEVNGMFEYACHEGNYGLLNILQGGREADRLGVSPNRDGDDEGRSTHRPACSRAGRHRHTVLRASVGDSRAARVAG